MKNIPYEGPRLPPAVQKKRMAKAIQGGLTQCQREILLSYYGGKTMAQIARERGINKSTVCRTVHRAENRLRKLLRY
ncbi:MAG TPA: sigma-70 family RNA polymerase sigma factor [Candidatus Faecousia faecipullorum]|nr:sigma-70 family RNA polymerase sigma factor [Candidatus Faecousia faecipullorum]